MKPQKPPVDSVKLRIRVYYEDTDCGGVVYYANYLKYMERGRTEYMREKGLSLSRLHGEGLLFVVSEAHVKYRAPARYDDVIEVETSVAEMSGYSITFRTEIRADDGAALAGGDVKVACVAVNGGLRRIPAEIVERLG